MQVSPLARVALALAAAHWCVCAQPGVRVAVYNLAGAPDWEIKFAVETAERAFRAGGVESHWVICGPNACNQDLPKTPYLELFLMPRLLAPIQSDMSHQPAGYAMPTGFARPRAYAFYDAARSVAERTLRPLYLVLGCILIHETGHLLGLHHQAHGAMRANLEAVDMDYTAMGRAFDAEEKRKLRAALRLVMTPMAPAPGFPPPTSRPGGAPPASLSTSASTPRAAPLTQSARR